MSLKTSLRSMRATALDPTQFSKLPTNGAET